MSIAQALESLAAIGIRRRPGVSDADLLLSLEGNMDSPVDWVDLLCVLGGDVERGKSGRIRRIILWSLSGSSFYPVVRS